MRRSIIIAGLAALLAFGPALGQERGGGRHGGGGFGGFEHGGFGGRGPGGPGGFGGFGGGRAPGGFGGRGPGGFEGYAGGERGRGDVPRYGGGRYEGGRYGGGPYGGAPMGASGGYAPRERFAPPGGYAGGGYPGGVARGGEFRRGQFLPQGYWGGAVADPRQYHLRRPPNGYGWVTVGPNAYLMQRSTGLILDTAPLY